MTARVSPDGNYLAFMSDMSLTGYDNEDVSSKAPGERLDEEVYLYDAETTNASSAPRATPPGRARGVFDVRQPGTGAAKASGSSSTVARSGAKRRPDRPLAGREHPWMDRPSRRTPPCTSPTTSPIAAACSSTAPTRSCRCEADEDVDRGRRATAGRDRERVPVRARRVGGCASEGGCVAPISSGTSEHESAFLDASANGNEVFFLTAAKLAPQDIDGNFDVYDAHVCEAASPCPPPPSPPPPPCEGEGCQGGILAAGAVRDAGDGQLRRVGQPRPPGAGAGEPVLQTAAPEAETVDAGPEVRESSQGLPEEVQARQGQAAGL